MVMQQAKLLLATLVCRIGTLACVLAAPLLIHLTANIHREAADNGLSTWAPDAQWETWLNFQEPSSDITQP